MKRSVEEITFDHSHERITEVISRGDKLTYRRNEIRLKKLFHLVNWLILPVLYLYIILRQNVNVHIDVESAKFEYIIIYGVMALFVMITFITVYCLLNKKHKMEFEKNRN